MLDEPAMGETTMGMGFCLSQEWEWWDARLNARLCADRARGGARRWRCLHGGERKEDGRAGEG
jgi:hypothetical protein